MLNSVKFHDKEVPILDDFNDITNHLTQTIKDLLSTIITDSDIVIKGLGVTQTASPSMGVLVSPDGTAGYGMAIKSTGDIINISATNTIAIDSNSSGQSRIDIIIAKEAYVDAEQENRYFRTNATTVAEQLVYTENSPLPTIVAIPGTPGSGVAPSMTPYSEYIKLAEVTVASGATSILNANIKDVSNAATWTTDASISTRYSALSLKAFRDEFDSRINQTLKTTSEVTFGIVNATTGNFTNGLGLLPIGSIIPIAIGLTGVGTDASMMLNGFAKCDGTSGASQVSGAVVAGTMPDINAGAFLRGASAYSATSGGSDTITLSEAQLATHTHSISQTTTGAKTTDINHTHGSFTSGGPSTNTSGGPSTNTSDGPSTTSTGTMSANTTHSHTGNTNTDGFHEHSQEVGGQAGAYKVPTGQAGNSGAQVGSSPAGYGNVHSHAFTTNSPNIDHSHSLSSHTHTMGSHTHTMGSHTHSTNISALGTTNLSTASDHTHSVSAANTGSASSITILPKYFSAVYYMRVK